MVNIYLVPNFAGCMINIPIGRAFSTCLFFLIYRQIGVGLLRYTPPPQSDGDDDGGSRDAAEGRYDILSNPRKTYLTPAGTGFLPRETAWHHQQVFYKKLKNVSCEYNRLNG